MLRYHWMTLRGDWRRVHRGSCLTRASSAMEVTSRMTLSNQVRALSILLMSQRNTCVHDAMLSYVGTDSVCPVGPNQHVTAALDIARGRLTIRSSNVTLGILNGVIGSDLRFFCMCSLRAIRVCHPLLLICSAGSANIQSCLQSLLSEHVKNC